VEDTEEVESKLLYFFVPSKNPILFTPPTNSHLSEIETNADFEEQPPQGEVVEINGNK